MARYAFDSVEIDGFRGLRGLHLDGLGLINILIGENNSGKTSVLEGISVLSDPYNPYEWLSMVARRDVGSLDENRIQSLRWCFHQGGELINPEFSFESECRFRCSGSFPLRNLTARYKDLIGEPGRKELKYLSGVGRLSRERTKRAHDGGWHGAELAHTVVPDFQPRQATLFDTEDDSSEPTAIRFWEGLPIRRRVPANRPRVESETLTPYSYQINRLLVRYQSEQLFSDDRRTLVLDLVRQFEPDVLDVSIASFWGGRPAIYLKHRRLGPAPLSVFGDALRRAVLLASTIPALGRGSMLLIDELETGIHVTALGSVFSWLIAAARQFEMQVIATTHSLEAVDAIVASAGSTLDDLVTFHLRQSSEQTRVKRLSGELVARIRHERGLDVR